MSARACDASTRGVHATGGESRAGLHDPLEKLGMVWCQDDLHRLIEEKMSGYRFVVVANREPFIHKYEGDAIEVLRPASGMASALDPVMLACDGTWVAHGSGDADRAVVDEHDRVRVPPEDPRYTLRRVWLTPEQEEGYYYGLANGGLWPLCHITFTRPRFDPRDWEMLSRGQPPLRRRGARGSRRRSRPSSSSRTSTSACCHGCSRSAHPRLIVAQFWHIPWPNREVFRTFPWEEELLDGLLGNDLLGFHVHYHCQNFLDTVDRGIEARVDVDRYEVHRGGHSTLVRPFPISIDFEAHDQKARSREVEAAMERWRRELKLGDEPIGVGIERLDYTKGIPDRLRGFDYLLETHPEYRGRLRFIQVAVPSRTHVPAYQQIDREVDEAGPRDQRPLAHRRLGADHVHQAAPGSRGDDGPAPARAVLHRQLAPRRHEPGGQGVRRQPSR